MQQDTSIQVLHAAFRAWMAAAQLRKSRLRNKRFTYGDQWGDLSIDGNGNLVTDWERYSSNGSTPVTNNLIRQLVRTIVGRYRAQEMTGKQHNSPALQRIATVNELEELDSHTLEEFLISGCCIQRVDSDDAGPRVTAVNPTRFFVNAMTDVRAWDCEIVGQLHDLSIAQLIQRVAANSRRKARWIRNLYTNAALERTEALTQRIGADTQSGTDFWQPSQAGKCRAIEVWTLESREAMMCHNRRTAQVTIESPSTARRHRNDPDVNVKWTVTTVWHCRWFSPMGDLLAEWDSPYKHHRHPFVM
ncbi:MAG: hypothetical protein KBT09_10380, partial [Bacteroidales bacterium]|nr:hypothetical protein [Candidatus Sodaliphilus fimicaballi]